MSSRPFGTSRSPTFFPTLKGWAILRHPFGTNHSRVSVLADQILVALDIPVRSYVLLG